MMSLSRRTLVATAMLLAMAGCAPERPVAPQVPAVPAPATGDALDQPANQVRLPDANPNPSPSPASNPVTLDAFGTDLDHPTVIIKDGAYHPYYVHVKLGGTVTWINQDAVTHSVTSPVPGGATQEGFWEGVMAPGQSYTRTFNHYTGTFTYTSKFNEQPVMHANVIVVGDRR